MISIDSLLESLSNPEGRFKTLQGIHLESSGGEPQYTLRNGGTVADFRVRWQGRSYVLKFFLRETESHAVRLRRLANFLSALRAPYLVEYLFCGEEMLVFDASDRPRYVDAVMMELPEGEPLGGFLTRMCDSGDTLRLSASMREFCRLGACLVRDTIVHGSLKPANIIVTPENKIRLLNYETMSVGQMDDCAECLGNDYVALANIALGLKVLSSAPEAYRALNGNSLFRSPVLRSSLLPVFDEWARQSGCCPMEAITQLLMRSNYALPSAEELADALERLADDTTRLMPTVEQLNRVRLEADAARVSAVTTSDPAEEEGSAADGGQSSRLVAKLARYDWAGRMEEALVCVQRNGRWGYLHSDGTEAIPLQYDWADDFLEGRAVVKIGEQFALIDKEGRAVLPPMYESIDWDCVHGVTQVSYEGRIGLYDRDGKELVEPTYDWMGDIRASELLLVRQDNLCGYIRHSGEVVIPLRYDDAFDFGDDGLAQVTLEGRTFCIDSQGREV